MSPRSELLIALFWIVRSLGVGLALFVIGAGFLTPMIPVEIATSSHPAQDFITQPPNSLLLFGSFLFPLSALRPTWVWSAFAIWMVVAAAILVWASIVIFRFQQTRLSTFLPSHMEEIALSGVVCLLQPLAVLIGRRLRLQRAVHQESLPT